MIARLLIENAPADRLFDYEVPEAAIGKLAVGQLLSVPFGHRQVRGFAMEIVEYCGKAIGAAAVTMIHALNPDIILLSGGVAEQGDLLVAPIREYVRTYSLYNTRSTPVRIAELGSKAGVVGAAALILAE